MSRRWWVGGRSPGLLPPPGLLLAGFALLVGADTAWGQGGGPPGGGGPNLGAQGFQDLEFGEVLGGVPTYVSPGDSGAAGIFRIRGRRGASVEIRFLLPSSLGGSGGSLPLTFQAGDALLSPDGDPGNGVWLDPTVPQGVSLPSQPWSFLFLGGTVLPPAAAGSGGYLGSITLIVSDLGSNDQ